MSVGDRYSLAPLPLIFLLGISICRLTWLMSMFVGHFKLSAMTVYNDRPHKPIRHGKYNIVPSSVFLCHLLAHLPDGNTPCLPKHLITA